MRETRMNTAPSCLLLSLGILPLQFVEGNGMEEVVGSIPTRSTNSLDKLGGASYHSRKICVMSCVITRCSGTRGKGLHGLPLCFHPHMAITFKHATAHVPGNRHDRGI